MIILYVAITAAVMTIPFSGWFRCLVGRHVLPKYPSRYIETTDFKNTIQRGCFICYRCTKEVVK